MSALLSTISVLRCWLSAAHRQRDRNSSEKLGSVATTSTTWVALAAISFWRQASER
jgi:hypothetical protein